MYRVETPPGQELWAILEALTAGCEVLQPLYQPAKGAVLEPAFPGFVFVRFDRVEFAWRMIVDPERGWRLLGPDNEHPQSVSDAEIERLRLVYGPGGAAETWQPPPPRRRLGVGSRVMVAAGPFTSFPGSVVAEQEDRMRVAVEILGRLTECDLPRDAVEPA